MENVLSLIIHLDKYLLTFAENYSSAIYVLLFLIIFAETGFVFTPFLPGDSLLFVAGALASQGLANVFSLISLLSLAAILGDSFNYWIGKKVGSKILSKRNLIKKEYIEKTEDFYKKHGKKTIILARFIPIVRTIAPFVAGIGK